MDFTEIIQLVGPGPVAVMLGIAWYALPKYFKGRDEDAARAERENTLRKVQIRINLSLLQFLKEKGYDVKIPDITETL